MRFSVLKLAATHDMIERLIAKKTQQGLFYDGATEEWNPAALDIYANPKYVWQLPGNEGPMCEYPGDAAIGVPYAVAPWAI